MKSLSKFSKLCVLCLLSAVLVCFCSTRPASAAATKITFKANGGTVQSKSEYTTTINTTAEYGSAIYYTKATRTGYTFDGWYSSSSGGTKASTSHMYTTVYAHWTPKSYTIKLNGNGNVASTSKTGLYGNKIQLPTLSHANDKFLGWATTSSAKQAQYSGGSYYVVLGDATLYAVWHKHSGPKGDCSHNGRCSSCGADISGTKDSNKHRIINGSPKCADCGKEITYADYLYAKGYSKSKSAFNEYLYYIGIYKDLIPQNMDLLADQSFAADFDMWKEIEGILKNDAKDATIKLLLPEDYANKFCTISTLLSCGKDLLEIYKTPDAKNATNHLISFSTNLVSLATGATGSLYFNIFSMTAKGAFLAAYNANLKNITDCNISWSYDADLADTLRMCIYVKNQCGKNTTGKYVELNSKDCPGFEDGDKYTFDQARALFQRKLSEYAECMKKSGK